MTVLSVVGATMGGMPPVVTDAPFVGRAEHLRRLAELLDAATDGQPAAVLVGGDAGVGKTRLVVELEDRARRRGFLVTAGRSVDLGAGGLPYLPFADALRSVARSGGPAADVLRRATEEWPVLLRLAGRTADAGPLDETDRLPLFDAVATVLARLGEEAGPVLLVVEDLHWADASTRDLLRFVLSRLRDERLLVVGTFRTDDLHRRHPLRPLLAELMRVRGVERLDLAPFDRVELGRLLVTVAGGAVPEGVVDDIARRSGGNAFFALELLAAHTPELGTGLTGALDALPEGLSDVLLTRLEGLGPPAQNVVRAASVAGRCVSDGLLRAVVADTTSGPELDLALREATDRHVLVADGPDRFSFRHALLQEAVYADLLPGERVRLHATYASRLADGAGDGEDNDADLAEHALRSHDLPGALGASWRAAREAQARLAPADSLEHAERALGLWSAVPADLRPGDGDHIELLLLAASAAAQSGDAIRAQALATAARDEALEDGEPVRVAQARRHLARHLYACDRLEACLEEARLARETLLQHPPSADLVWATAVMASAAGSLGDRAEMAALARSGLELARSLGLAAAEADLLITSAIVDGDGAPVTAGRDLEVLREARERARDAGEPAIELRALWNVGLSRHEADDLMAAADSYRQVEALAVQTGLSASLYAVGARVSLVEVLFRLGSWDEALAVARADGLRLSRFDTTGLRVGALRVTAARDPQAARDAAARLRAADADDLALDSFSDISLHVTQAEAAASVGDRDDAVTHVGLALERIDARYATHLLALRVCAVGLAALAGDRTRTALADAWAERAEAAMRSGAPHRGRSVGPEGTAWLLRARAERARFDGPAPEVAAWEEILGLVEGQPYEQARCRLRLAEALVAAGERVRAGEVAAQAFAAASRLGARPLCTELEALGRRARLDLGAGVPSSDGPLTPREAQVLRLVAAGMTNRAIGERLFISEKTASVHVSNILGKLGASGRTEAVAIASRRGLLAVGGAPGATA